MPQVSIKNSRCVKERSKVNGSNCAKSRANDGRSRYLTSLAKTRGIKVPPWKFNCLPLKIGPGPQKGKYHGFQRLTVKLREDITLRKTNMPPENQWLV